MTVEVKPYNTPGGQGLKKVKVKLEITDKNNTVITHECEFHHSVDYPLALELEAGSRELISKEKWNVPGLTGFRRLIIYGKARKD